LVSALSPKQLGKKKTFQREKNLIFDFFLQKKIKNQIYRSLEGLFFFSNCLGLKALTHFYNQTQQHAPRKRTNYQKSHPK
jgi:hypothetical protein